jgi:hypothetical protein
MIKATLSEFYLITLAPIPYKQINKLLTLQMRIIIIYMLDSYLDLKVTYKKMAHFVIVKCSEKLLCELSHKHKYTEIN